MAEKPWVVYLLKCGDNTLYCGVTNDLPRRLRQHNGEIKGGAKYTQARRPCKLVYQEACEEKSAAMKREYDIKQLSRVQKQQLFSVADALTQNEEAIMSELNGAQGKPIDMGGDY